MRNSTIENLAYRIKQAKENNEPKPIVFLGAGASKTGEIPLAGEIVSDILERYKTNPEVKAMKEEDRTYPKLMNCLTPFERNALLKEYIDRAKINVTHIYLAQLIHLGYVDYVLTVNFDNLMLRALALYNEFPPTYDMAILKDLTTTTFKEKSVLYLHGQHHGLWLLNTQEEMDKVKEFVPPILNKISNQRMWIFIGYSGYDPIFKHIVNLGRFDNGLYWVGYKDNIPGDNVCAELLDKPNTNAFIIKGYDSDSFILKLYQQLELPQPSIFDTPFSSLKEQLENIVDIDDDEHFKGVKERLEIVKSQVETAINQFEKGVIKTEETLKDDAGIDILKKEIIDKIVNKNFNEDEIAVIEEKVVKSNNAELNEQLANLYLNWGIFLRIEADFKNDESLYRQSFKKYEKATILNPKDDIAFNNLGNVLTALAKIKNNESLYRQAIEKYETAMALNPQNASAFNNWGVALSDLAKMKNDESLYQQAIEKYETATALNPKYTTAFKNWGTTLINLGKMKNDESFYQQAIEKSIKAIDLGSSPYNLACAYALIKDKDNALKYLENALQNNQQTVSYVENDDDWKGFVNDEDFKELLTKYPNGKVK